MSSRITWVAFGVMGLFVLGLTLSADGGWLHPPPPPFDKVMHFGLMGGLGWLLHLCLKRRHWGVVPVGPAIVALGSCLDELHQHWQPRRDFSLGDLAANLLGVVTLYALDRWWQARRAAQIASENASTSAVDPR